jgi:hypothetical protein
MLQLRAQKQVVAAGYTRQKLAAALPPGRTLEDVLKDKASIEALPVSREVKAAGLELHDLVRLSNMRQRQPANLDLVVNGIPSGRYRVSEYRIDANSGSSAYAMRGKIDENALQQSKQAGRAAARDYLAQRWSEKEVAQAQQLIQSGDMGAIMDRVRGLPPQRRQDVEKALQVMDEVRFGQARKINERLQPRPEKVSEVTIDGTGTLRLDLPPYGLVLLEFEPI